MNNVCLLGRLTADPELRHTPNGNATTTFIIAVNRPYKDKDGSLPVDFITIVAWRQTAELVCKHFIKGRMIAVQGSIQTGSYTDKDGNKRKTFEILANHIHFADSKRDNTGNGTSTSASVSSCTISDNGEFEEIMSDDDLPF